MCGIAGFIEKTHTGIAEDLVVKMTGLIQHRGPDDEGFYFQPPAYLGHRRLSIIDIETGHQPMVHCETGTVIIYNGEIYNFLELRKQLELKGHIFTTQSDTEVLLNGWLEWREDVLAHLNGMFAFGIWKPKTKTLFLARDRLGIKPLYYCETDDYFAFASELRSLACIPDLDLSIDIDAVSSYLQSLCISEPLTIYNSCKRLAAGNMLSLNFVNDNQTSNMIFSYWDVQFPEEQISDEEAILPLLDTNLSEAVKRHLVSDVPVGVFLSGGVDSSTVAWYAAQHSEKIQTFCVGFEDDLHDESQYAEEVARSIDAEHYTEILTEEYARKAVWDILEKIDEPFADSSLLPTYLVSQMARKSVKVVLSGDAGDELFGGYPWHNRHRGRTNDLYDNLPPFLRNLIGSMAAIWSGEDRIGQIMGKGLISRLTTFTPQERRAMLCKDNIEYHPVTRDLEFAMRTKGLKSLDRQMYADLKTFLSEQLLVKIDRASMMDSLEVRPPLLDCELVEFVCSISPKLRMLNRQNKYLLYKLMKNRLPSSVFSRPKSGFSIPIIKWLRGPLKQELRDLVEDSNSFCNSYFDMQTVKFFLSGGGGSLRGSSHKLWAIYCLENWWQNHGKHSA